MGIITVFSVISTAAVNTYAVYGTQDLHRLLWGGVLSPPRVCVRACMCAHPLCLGIWMENPRI